MSAAEKAPMGSSASGASAVGWTDRALPSSNSTRKAPLFSGSMASSTAMTARPLPRYRASSRARRTLTTRVMPLVISCRALREWA